MMDRMRLLALALGSAAAGAAGLAGAAVAAADDADPSVQLGQQAQVIDGGNIQGWTVNGLQPSGDAIPYQPGGTLWEATATAEAIAGGGLPFVPGFSARAANGDDYRALFQVATPEGVNPTPLSQGQSTTGKLYFDVTGEAPDSVVFGDRLTWLQPPPGAAPATGSATGSAPQIQYSPQSGYAAPQAGVGVGTGTAGQAAAAQAAPAQSAPAKPAATAPASAPDDVHGAAVPAQPKQSTAPLDVHDTTAPPTTPAQAPTTAAATPAQAPATAAPAAPVPTSSAPAPAAAMAAPAQPVIPTTVAPKPAASSGS